MQGTSFVVLTGHLNDYPLSHLIGMLRRQRKTGRLLIEYPAAPCSLYFENGNLVDAQLSTLSGLQAIYVALSQPNASFNFNPLIQPPHHSIDGSAQKVLLESLGCWEEKVVEVQATANDSLTPTERPPTREAARATLPLKNAMEELPEASARLALPAAPTDRVTILKREVLTASIIILSLLSLLAIMALTGRPIKNGPPTTSLQIKDTGSTTSPNKADDSSVKTVRVVVQIEKGRVSQAFIAHPQPGLESYEALALRVARGRHYPTGTTGQETISVEIKSLR